ncbi:MAG: hypothetical protein E7576_00580 [Ruminococcaceae bacterium]|jgi:hypothetical protein|nr:hypothetical protein [Oscillospiraceae bacterium]
MAETRIVHQNLTLTADPAAFVYAVTLPNGDVWRMTERPSVTFSDGRTVPFPAPSEESPLANGTSDGVRAVYEGFEGSALRLETVVRIERTTGDLFFEIFFEGDRFGEIASVAFPAPFEKEGGGYTVLSRMQGALIPDGSGFVRENEPVNERTAYMPIFGQVRGGSPFAPGTSGYLAVFDTPFDARYSVRDDRVSPLWVPSLGEMRYARRMLYRFRETCDYNTIALCYRAYVKERGRLVTLREKAARNPNVERLFGAPVIHAGIAIHVSPESDYYNKDEPWENDCWTTFDTQAERLRELKKKGLDVAYTHFDGWGRHGYDNLHPSPFPPHEEAGGTEGMKRLAEACRECGYIFGIHDQYRDYYYDGPDFSLDEAIQYIDGSHPYCSVWHGGPHSFLCSARAVEYVRRNYAEFERLGIPVEAAYLDVFSVVEMDECFSKAHPVTREQCAENRRRCLDILTDRGIIPSSEEILDCILPSQVLCHHAPFFTSSLGSPNSDPIGIPIPLLNLVYHDCAVIPWIGLPGEHGGWGIPGKDSAYLYAILCGNPVYCSITATEEEIAAVKTACASAKRLTHTAIVRHEFLDGSIRRQRTTFSDGTVIEADFDTDEYSIVAP